MSELTDEQLREWRDFELAGAGPRAMATELLALRAERAKLEAALDWALSRFREMDDGFSASTLTALAQPAESGATEAGLIDKASAGKAAEAANKRFGQWMPEKWLWLFVEEYNRAGAKP